jgi:hypothetical protein
MISDSSSAVMEMHTALRDFQVSAYRGCSRHLTLLERAFSRSWFRVGCRGTNICGSSRTPFPARSLICPAWQAPKRKIFLFFRSANHCNNRTRPTRQEGRLANVTNVRWDAVDVERAIDECARDGWRSRVVLTPQWQVSSSQEASFLGATVTNKPWSRRGEHGISLKPSRRESRDVPGYTCGPTPVLFFAQGPWVRSAPGFPCALP